MADQDSSASPSATANRQRRGAILLAGGRSRRMGTDKCAMTVDGRSMLRCVADAVRSQVDAVVVVTRNPEQSLPVDVGRTIRASDQRPGGGPLEAILAGWQAMASNIDVALICGCDVPLLSPLVVDRLFHCIGEHDAAVPRIGDRSQPLTAVYRRASASIIEQCLGQGEASMHELLTQLDVAWVEESTFADVDPDLESFLNVNNPDDYATVIRRLEARARGG